MSNENPANPSALTIDPISVTKNGITMTLTAVKETKGKGANTFYIGDETPYTIAQLAAIMGESYVQSRLTSLLKANLKECEDEVTSVFDENGKQVMLKSPDGSEEPQRVPLDATKMKATWESWSFVNESKAKIKESIYALLQQMLALPDDNSVENTNKAHALKEQMRVRSLDLARKSRSTSAIIDDEDTETAAA